MHRVELKDFFQEVGLTLFYGFLMHRVELKEGNLHVVRFHKETIVPNAPCGVERKVGIE